MKSKVNLLGSFKSLNTIKHLKNLKTSSSPFLNFTFPSQPPKSSLNQNLTSNHFFEITLTLRNELTQSLLLASNTYPLPMFCLVIEICLIST